MWESAVESGHGPPDIAGDAVDGSRMLDTNENLPGSYRATAWPGRSLRYRLVFPGSAWAKRQSPPAIRGPTGLPVRRERRILRRVDDQPGTQSYVRGSRRRQATTRELEA